MTRRPRSAPDRRARHDADPKVAIAWISPGQVETRFMSSVLGMMSYEIQKGRGHLVHDQAFIELISSPRIAEARSQIVDIFLKGSAEWLLMIDADMTFAPDTLDRMLFYADPERVPVLGGLCYAGGRQGSPIYPTLYEKQEIDGVPAPRTVTDFPSERVPRNQLVRVYATGAAALLVHRSVWERMQVAYARLANGKPNPYPWFVEGTVDPNGYPLGEDISFCMRLEPLDIPVHVHTGIEFGHIKTRELNTAVYLKERADADHR